MSRLNSKIIRPFFPSFAGRCNDQLPDTLVKSATLSRLKTDVRLYLSRKSQWEAIIRRNLWFSTWAAEHVAQGHSNFIFSYSYTARESFKVASRRNSTCILGQIDPGPLEETLVQEKVAGYRDLAISEPTAPKLYWDLWRDEVALARKIIVNSSWSSKLLVRAGIPKSKIVEIPLVFHPSPIDFTSSSSVNVRPPVDRRIKALFLGGVILRKGIGQLFAAISRLRGEPIDFLFAGPIGVHIPASISGLSNVTFLGPVSHEQATVLYRNSDILLFPTLSDGFGLVQLEALANGLPVIASKNCARVVDHRINGLVLSDVSSDAIIEALELLLTTPSLLLELKSNAFLPDKFHPSTLTKALSSLS